MDRPLSRNSLPNGGGRPPAPTPPPPAGEGGWGGGQGGRDARPRSGRNFSHTRAMTLARPPVESFTFEAPTTTVAPASGTLSRLATFSRPQRPDGSHSWWVLKVRAGPG